MKRIDFLKQFKNCWTIFPAAGIICSFFWLMGFICPVYRNITIDSVIVKQGNTLSVTIDGIRSGSVLSCRYNGKEIPLYDSGTHSKKGLIPVAVLEEQGSRNLRIAYNNFWQEARADSHEFFVTAGTFKKEHIKFTKSKRKLYKNPKISSDSKKLAASYRRATSVRYWQGTFIWPVKSKRRVTSPFGSKRVYHRSKKVNQYHKGVDISARTGTKIYAANDGIVCMAEQLVLSGYTVAIDHGQGVLSFYKHLSKISVRVGSRVAKGDLLGRAGSGGLSTGPHLHWELRVHGVPVNPIEWIEKEF